MRETRLRDGNPNGKQLTNRHVQQCVFDDKSRARFTYVKYNITHIPTRVFRLKCRDAFLYK